MCGIKLSRKVWFADKKASWYLSPGGRKRERKRKRREREVEGRGEGRKREVEREGGKREF
jgi:hypothetical protein